MGNGFPSSEMFIKLFFALYAWKNTLNNLFRKNQNQDFKTGWWIYFGFVILRTESMVCIAIIPFICASVNSLNITYIGAEKCPILNTTTVKW